jgi:arylsulfatase
MHTSRCICFGLLASLASVLVQPASAQQPPQKPNILVIMGDDIGYWNISAYNRGQMGYRTPNIDRIANEGAIFTDYVSSPAPPGAPLSSPVSHHCAPGC